MFLDHKQSVVPPYTSAIMMVINFLMILVTVTTITIMVTLQTLVLTVMFKLERIGTMLVMMEKF